MAENRSHENCEHAETKYARWRCRAEKRHAGCDHEQNPTGWRFCEDAARIDAARAKAKES